ncbi:hypothetical protein N7510_004287 [Penicillium lagena]|uniref:uncharacterized protein n=1 Tax=Penicillium lagena TaxID=94218 RepID=UPI00254056F9|nr:uncharacterized protein N7510_004287 [Penicillium lagena]KAJ5620303.1 hypothetical protein N7510_004287 [Penicillium lagena]
MAVSSTIALTFWPPQPLQCAGPSTTTSAILISDMNDDPGVQFMGARSTKQMSEDSFENGQSSSWHQHFHPLEPNPARDHLPPLRYPGDGFDFRRPARAGTPQEEEVIDLTNEPETPPQRTQNRTSASQTPSSSRLPRFGRDIMTDVTEVVDLLEEDPDIPAEVPSSSPEVQFVGAVRRPPANRSPHHRFEGYFQRMRATRPHSRIFPPHRERADTRELRRGTSFGSGLPSFTDSFLLGDHPDSVISFLNLNYESASFPIGPPIRQEPRTSRNTYKAPSPPPAGFTRTLADDDVAVCPNCSEELGVGEGTKQELWIARQCGHVSTFHFSLFFYILTTSTQVYCGECAENRSLSKAKKSAQKTKPFSKCQVTGCGKAVSQPTAMIHIFL